MEVIGQLHAAVALSPGK